MKVAVLFDRFGPYHVARLSAAAAYMDVISIELFGKSTEYKWDKVNELDNRITLFAEKAKNEVSSFDLYKKVHKTLELEKPDAVAINGWSDKGALSALHWCIKRNVPVVVMSESGAIDEHRVWWKEWIKRRIINRCSAGLVGGIRHAAYLQELGMPANAIFTGYDVIDNHYFSSKVKDIRAGILQSDQKLNLPEQYFLASSRFVQKKNLFSLIKAYALYRKFSEREKPHQLVLLGDGELKHALIDLIENLQLSEVVHLAGFKQYHELPFYYAYASSFIHASTVEQWGLVVNEAMAAGLPVAVSNRCGCAPDLVKDGINGYTFDPYDDEALASILATCASEEVAKKMGEKSAEIIDEWQPDKFGKGLRSAVQVATATPSKEENFIDERILQYLLFKK